MNYEDSFRQQMQEQQMADCQSAQFQHYQRQQSLAEQQGYMEQLQAQQQQCLKDMWNCTPKPPLYIQAAEQKRLKDLWDLELNKRWIDNPLSRVLEGEWIAPEGYYRVSGVDLAREPNPPAPSTVAVPVESSDDLIYGPIDRPW